MESEQAPKYQIALLPRLADQMTDEELMVAVGFEPGKHASLAETVSGHSRHAEIVRTLFNRWIDRTMFSGTWRQTKEFLDSPRAACAAIHARLAHEPTECFAALWLDTEHRILAFEILFRGSIQSAQTYPREIVRRAFRINASAVIFAHNHPSGNTSPSQTDLKQTEALERVLSELDICVLDHIIVGEGTPYSFANHGLL